MTDPTNFMKMFFHSIALCFMTAVSEKKEKDEGWNTYHVPGTVLVTLGIYFFYLVLTITLGFLLIPILPVRKLRCIVFK